MSTTVVSIFQFKRGTEARWEEVNPTLKQGEPGFVYNKNKLKIGDGVTPWRDLPYVEGKTEIISASTITNFLISIVVPFFSATSKNSVSTGPGQTAVTVISKSLNSSFNARLKLNT